MVSQTEILDVIRKHPEGIRQLQLAAEFGLPEKALNRQISKLARRNEITRQILYEQGRPYKIFPLNQR